MVDLGEGIQIREDVWDELETCNNSKFVKNLILAVWGDELANRCLDEKAAARVPGQTRKPLSPKKKLAVQRCFNDRLELQQGLKGRELKTAKVIFGRAITEKINGLNKKKTTHFERTETRENSYKIVAKKRRR